MKGIGPGLVTGAVETVKLPYTLGKAAVDTAVGGFNLVTKPGETIRKTGDTLSAIPGRIKTAVSDAATKAATDPEGFGKDVGNLTGQIEGGIATGVGAGRMMPLVPKAVARNVGQVMETVGANSQYPSLVVGTHQLAQGNLSGFGTMGLPLALKKGGRGLQNWGEGPSMATTTERWFTPEEMAAQRAAQAPAPPPVSRVQTLLDEGQAAGKYTDIRQKPGGPAPKFQSIRERQAADPSFGKPAEPAAPLGKAASDLANGTNPAPRPPVGPQSIMDEMTQRNGNGVSPAAMEADAVLAGENARRSATGDVGGGPAARAAVLAPEAPRPARVVTQEGIPASKSKSPMSNTPGLTRADLEAAGMNPDLNYKNLTPEKIAQIKANRSSRHGTHYANARTDKGLKSLFEDALRNMDPERLR
jgi:hypothetical protein